MNEQMTVLYRCYIPMDACEKTGIDWPSSTPAISGKSKTVVEQLRLGVRHKVQSVYQHRKEIAFEVHGTQYPLASLSR